MCTGKEFNKNIRENVKNSLDNGDIVGILKMGIDNFCRILERPLSFQGFLSSVEQYLDDMILAFQKQENLRYIGGKLTLNDSRNENRGIRLHAIFYFQNAKKEWITKEKSGFIPCDRLKDWDTYTSPDLRKLRETGSMEFPIESPDEGKSS